MTLTLKNDKIVRVVLFQVQLSLPGHLQSQHWLVVACYLVKNGADLTAVNSSGKTPMDYASDSVQADILHRYVDESVDLSTHLHCQRSQTFRFLSLLIGVCLVCLLVTHNS